MLNEWNNHQIPINPPPQPPIAPSPDSDFLIFNPQQQLQSQSLFRDFHHNHGQQLVTADLSIKMVQWFLVTGSFTLLWEWALYCVAVLSLVALQLNPFMYTIIHTLLILLEAALVSFILIDRRWETDLPKDPTGQLDSFRSFIEDNSDLCAWVGITVVVIQALALLLAIFLRAMISTRKNEFGDESDYETGRVRIREPLLNPQSGQTSGSTHPDNIWSSRIREKYGLNIGGDKYNSVNQNASSSSMKSK
ncbi:hypothetical protein ACFE04_029676 [Oxalis oulophora]